MKRCEPAILRGRTLSRKRKQSFCIASLLTCCSCGIPRCWCLSKQPLSPDKESGCVAWRMRPDHSITSTVFYGTQQKTVDKYYESGNSEFDKLREKTPSYLTKVSWSLEKDSDRRRFVPCYFTAPPPVSCWWNTFESFPVFWRWLKTCISLFCLIHILRRTCIRHDDIHDVENFWVPPALLYVERQRSTTTTQ